MMINYYSTYVVLLNTEIRVPCNSASLYFHLFWLAGGLSWLWCAHCKHTGKCFGYVVQANNFRLFIRVFFPEKTLFLVALDSLRFDIFWWSYAWSFRLLKFNPAQLE